MRPKLCETCNAFQVRGEKLNEDGSNPGECRANPPVITAQWVTPQGSGWQGGYPPTNSKGWCRKHESKVILGSVPGGRE